MNQKNVYQKIVKIIHLPFISMYVYWMNPGGVEGKHFHDGIEIEYVLIGNTKTHKKGAVYFRKSGQIHEGINDSKDTLLFICITIPAEDKKNTHYL